MKTRVKINSAELVKSLLDRQLSAKEAERIVGVTPAYLSQLLQCDRHVGYKLASKFRSEFGDRAITIN